MLTCFLLSLNTQVKYLSTLITHTHTHTNINLNPSPDPKIYSRHFGPHTVVGSHNVSCQSPLTYKNKTQTHQYCWMLRWWLDDGQIIQTRRCSMSTDKSVNIQILVGWLFKPQSWKHSKSNEAQFLNPTAALAYKTHPNKNQDFLFARSSCQRWQTTRNLKSIVLTGLFWHWGCSR